MLKSNTAIFLTLILAGCKTAHRASTLEASKASMKGKVYSCVIDPKVAKDDPETAKKYYAFVSYPDSNTATIKTNLGVQDYDPVEIFELTKASKLTVPISNLFSTVFRVTRTPVTRDAYSRAPTDYELLGAPKENGSFNITYRIYDPQHPRSDNLLSWNLSCSSDAVQASSAGKKSIGDTVWEDATTTGNGTTPSSCTKNPENCSYRDTNSDIEFSKIAPNAMNWDQALNYCAHLVFNGKNDWHLPNQRELEVAYLHEICKAGFPCVNYFMTATESDSADRAVHLDLANGNDSSSSKSEKYPVFCARHSN